MFVRPSVILRHLTGFFKITIRSLYTYIHVNINMFCTVFCFAQRQQATTNLAKCHFSSLFKPFIKVTMRSSLWSIQHSMQIWLVKLIFHFKYLVSIHYNNMPCTHIQTHFSLSVRTSTIIAITHRIVSQLQLHQYARYYSGVMLYFEVVISIFNFILREK